MLTFSPSPQVETLMAKLRVDEEHLVTLMSLGYSAKECRIALRQTNNMPELALTYLDEKKMLRKQEYERWKQEQQGKYLQVTWQHIGRASETRDRFWEGVFFAR